MPFGNTMALQGSHSLPRKIRQSDLDALAENESPVPLRQSKGRRRESKLGLRNLFGRSSKAAAKEEDGPASPKTSSRPGGIRASIAEMGHWPYGQQARSELTLPTTNQPWDILHEQPEPAHDISRETNSGVKRKPGMVTPKQSQNAVAAWSVPPLFKAYPQAIRQGALPAVTLSAEAILRLNEKKALVGVDPTLYILELGGENSSGDKDKLKRRNRSNSLAASNLQWTTKIYVLVTSGYLLQYSGDGSFDRPPEKVLRLGQSSAAFATDVLPGRHWVLQVSSAADSDARPPTDSRSLFSKLGFRTSERRHAPNLFMVFDSAENMEEWLISLRSVIEKMGGKKSLSETGVPKTDDSDLYLREQPSQRTIIIRDPARFARIPSPSRQQERELGASDCSTTVTDYDAAAQDASLDDLSATNSVVSHDGCQLDNLRDSSNRLSLLSSGQRTMVTSTTSSPESSPILDRFPRPGDGLLHRDAKAIPEARLRPNAGSILTRRMSLQTIAPFYEEESAGGAAEYRPLSSACGPTARGDETVSPLGSQPTPNFSVPHSSTRRYSYVKTPWPEQDAVSSLPKEAEVVMPRTSLRKLTVRTGRPLSTVEDQPSPKESIPARPVTSHHAQVRPLTPSMDVPKVPRGRLMSVPHVPIRHEVPGRRMSLMPEGVSGRCNPPPGPRPRRPCSRSALRSQDKAAGTARLPASCQPSSSTPQLAVPWADRSRRRRSSMDPSESSRSFPVGLSRAAKRASIGSTYSDRSASGEAHAAGFMEPLPMRAPPPTGPLPPIPSTASKHILKMAMPTKVLVSKRSMPQLVAEGPPLVPPPTCALPPIPQRPAAKA